MKSNQWSPDWPDDAPRSPDGLRDHVAARYRHFRRLVEWSDDPQFSLLLSTEGVRDDMHAYDEQPSVLLRLAQIGHLCGRSRGFMVCWT
jgi:hypothetical protein